MHSIVIAGLAAALLLAASIPASAVDYQLRVVSLYEQALLSYLRPGETRDAAAGPGLDRLEAALDHGQMPMGSVLWDRRVLPVFPRAAQAWGGQAVEAALVPAGDGRIWDEVRWQGNPGEQTVWIISPGGRLIQELSRLALRGTGPMRHYLPYSPAWDVKPEVAVKYPLNFIWFHEERGTLWGRHVSRSLDLRSAVGVVVGVNDNAPFPDSVYVVVKNAPEPMTYKVALGWRQRPTEREAPSQRDPLR